MALVTKAESRKARRKQERQKKKKKRPIEKTPEAEKEEETKGAVQPKAKRRRAKEETVDTNDLPSKKKSSGQYTHLDEETAAAMQRDDAEIAALEAKLGMGNKKDRSRLHKEHAKLEGYGDDFGSFLDGIDDMVTRVLKPGEVMNGDDDSGSFDDDGEEMHMREAFELMGHEDDSTHDDEDAHASDSTDSSESNSEQEEEEEEEKDMKSEPVLERKEEVDSASSDDGSDDDGSDEDSEEPDHKAEDTYRPSRGEDIYGNRVAKESSGQPVQKYVPPHLRKKQKEDDSARSESLRDLDRALNNSLNRLSEDTLISVAQSITKLYSSFSTPDVNERLWKNVVNACISRPIVMTGMIPVYVACLAGVHLQTSDNVQLGGFLLEQVITSLWQELARLRSERADETGAIDQDNDVSKETSNIMLVLCYLYNFSVAHCTLLYDVVRNLIDHFTEIDVELLLLILSHCGHALRADDPSALKDIVLLVQKKALTIQSGDGTQSSRVEYMVSAMSDLKNNKKRKQDQAYGEKTAKLRKLLGRIKSMAAASGSARSSDACLRITLQDILNAESKGRWWKVGACWVGNQYTHKGDDDSSDDEEESPIKSGTPKRASAASEEEEAMLKLASKHRMNSDIRRSIFCIIMGSADCDDAFEKLVRAGMLKNRTERDTVRVLVECCGSEKTFNPYYAHLASRICDYQPQCKFTFQLCFWDAFKQFDTMKLRKAANLAKLLFHLVAVHRTLRMNVLKTIDMSPDSISETASIFLTIFFSNIFDTFDDPSSVVQLFPQERPTSAMGSVPLEESNEEGSDGLRESLSVFFLQTLKSSPKNKKKSKFRANFKAAVKACETDGLDFMAPA